MSGWILNSVLVDKESIADQLIEHFDAVYGIGNIEDENPREFKKAVNILAKKYLK